MRDHDLAVRERLAKSGELFKTYHAEMEQVHVANAQRLHAIIAEIGWPDEEKVGPEANEAAFLIVQHGISLPGFQRACLREIEAAIRAGKGSKRHYAFLYDRICFNERRPQRFGTQHDWDANDEMSPWIIEDAAGVNERRKEYGLNPLEEETAAIREGVRQSGERAPKAFAGRQKEVENWAREKGWLK